MKRSTIDICLLLTLLFSAGACGKYGPPNPPEDFAPQAIRFFQAAGSLKGIELNWQAPLQDMQGEPLRNLEQFVIRRSPYIRGASPDFETIAEIRYQQEPETTVFRFLDENVEANKRYEYAVSAENSDGTEGQTTSILRVTFRGESSTIEFR